MEFRIEGDTWTITKLMEDQRVFGSKTSGPYLVNAYDEDGREMSGSFFGELEEAIQHVQYEFEEGEAETFVEVNLFDERGREVLSKQFDHLNAAIEYVHYEVEGNL